MTLTLNFAARSHQGLLRDGNEDSVYAGPRLLAVADGMGGHAAGEVASAVAIASLAPLDDDVPGADLLEALRSSALSANAHLRDMVAGDETLEGMGTTLTAILSAGNRLGLLHVGDSRCYLLREGELSQITHDHTLVQVLVDEGRITEDEAGSHPQRSVITRVLDGRRGMEFDLSVREARAGDRYLLCSDGLTGPVGSKDTLREALQLTEPQAAVDRLVQLALKGGGPDNVTVIVADVVDSEASGTASPVVAGAAAEAPQAPPPGIADSPAGRAQVAEGRVRSHHHVAPVLHRPRRRGRAALTGLLIVVLLGGAAAAGWAYVRSQYFVGVDGKRVAVFRGVTGSVAGIRLSSLEQGSDLTTDQLSDLDMARVRRGILAKDRTDAVRIVHQLEIQADRSCVTVTPAAPLPHLPAVTPKPSQVIPSAPTATAPACVLPSATPTQAP
ncbi:MAG: protein phosphatase 2C domain-containing protein [Actinomycetota bacterium]|nr:protein phosphatase 2C domain-containing protein [Actinomycetota bacterium]